MLQVGFVLTPGFQMMTLAAASVFEFANLVAEDQLYRVDVLSEGGGTVVSSIGIPVETRRLEARGYDTLIFGTGIDVVEQSPEIIDFAKRASKSARENLRLEVARIMMEQSVHPTDVVATETGFADPERMRRAFIRAFGQPPMAVRRNARSLAAAS